MDPVTFSQFRNNAKRYFDAVEKGETVEIYRHGKPVALLTPVLREPPLRRWRTANPIRLPGVSASRLILDERRKNRF